MSGTLAQPTNLLGVLPQAGATAPKVIEALIKVKRDVTSIAKEGDNKSDRYSYIRAIDVMAALQQKEAEWGLMVAMRMVSWKIENKVLAVTYVFDVHHESGEAIFNFASHIGSCRFEFKSGTTDDKAFAKALTSCQKGAHLHLYKIPSEDAVFDDADQQGVNDREPSRRMHDDDRGRGNDRRDDRGRDDRRSDNRRDDTRQGSANGQWRDNAPPAGGPDDYGAGEGERRDPPPGDETDRESENFRLDCQRLRDDLKKARDERDAAQIWVGQGDLINQMGNVTFQHFREDYYSRWHCNPPNV